jgi:DNA-binding NtrC family response regulator
MNPMTSPKTRVLIVDDEDRFRATMRKLLAVRGLEASTAGTGREALEELNTNPYDVVILDVKMPELGGVEVLAEIKKIDPFIEVIVMTGYASVDTAKKITELGGYDYLLKPYNIDELMEKIDAAHDRKIARTQLVGGLDKRPNPDV